MAQTRYRSRDRRSTACLRGESFSTSNRKKQSSPGSQALRPRAFLFYRQFIFGN
jgi:hypothetical protein